MQCPPHLQIRGPALAYIVDVLSVSTPAEIGVSNELKKTPNFKTLAVPFSCDQYF